MRVSITEIYDQLKSLYYRYTAAMPVKITPLPSSGSSRLYFRIQQNDNTVIGVYNSDIAENKAFFVFTEHFRSKGLNTPEILITSKDMQYYLLNDLGNDTLYNKVTKSESSYNPENIELLKKAITHLVGFQTTGFEGFETEWGYPKGCFDKQSIMWDLNYFKYSFLKPLGINFNEEKLELAFERFSDYLLMDDMNFFHYRDFQSRNIMVVDGELFFIDYQGGRKGPCLYDVASFLYQAKAAMPESIRSMLFSHYLEELGKKRSIYVEQLRMRFPAFVLFRILQTLGAYGFRGNFERKQHFLLSIPLAVDNLKNLVKTNQFDFGVDYLLELIQDIITNVESLVHKNTDDGLLTVEISSFSFMNGYPKSNPEHGGGFIFDCRFLPNPGRLPEYKSLTGLDSEVVKYLEKEKDVVEFINYSKSILENVIDSYLRRKYNYLSVGFGCTGGQHRSVYCASVIAAFLQNIDGVRVKLEHREILS